MAVLARLPFLAVFLMPAVALAQQPAATTSGPTGTPAAPPATATATPTAAPAGTDAPPPAAPPASTGPVSGYGWGGNTRPAAPVRRYSVPTGPIAVLPGFQPLPDGASRFFVELTKAVPVEEHKAKGTITYVLKGAHVAIYNNQRPLVTVHFNTPAWRARLVPFGADLHFVLEMRADVAPTFKVDTAQSGRATLEIDFPAGQFLANDMPEMPPTGGPATTTAPVTGPQTTSTPSTPPGH